MELLKFQLPPDSQLVDKQLMELPGLIKAKVLICAVERGENEVYIPTGNSPRRGRPYLVRGLAPAMRSSFSGSSSSRPDASATRCSSAAGASHLSGAAAGVRARVTIIESNHARCEELSAALPKATILHGDGTNEAFLRESGIEQCDAFAALTGIDEENVLMGLYVRKTWPKVKVVTKINRYSLPPSSTRWTSAASSIALFPRRTSSAAMSGRCRIRRDRKIETLYKLVGGKAEALEFRVAESSAVCGVPLLKLELRPNLLVCCINRGGQILIPSG